MSRIEKQNSDIPRLDYRPAVPYQLDLEIFSASDLRRRGSKGKIRTTHRYEFHMLVYVAHGTCTQLIDFKPVLCEPGSLLTLRPGQAHNFGADEDWDGWIILFRPEFLLATSVPIHDLRLMVNLERFPEHLILRDHELRSVMDVIVRMREDTLLDATLEDMHSLLRYQLYALLSRLNIFHAGQQEHDTLNSPLAMQRFKRFQKLLEESFFKWHQVAEYAEKLGCTEKSLTRASTVAVGMSAKTFIASRINLEAKRLLVHTDLPVTRIAEKLGFGEATNFSKFFKRETGCTPAEFRRRQLCEISPFEPRRG